MDIETMKMIAEMKRQLSEQNDALRRLNAMGSPIILKKAYSNNSKSRGKSRKIEK